MVCVLWSGSRHDDGAWGGEGTHYLVHLEPQLVAHLVDRALLLLGLSLELRIGVGIDGRLLFSKRCGFPCLKDKHVIVAGAGCGEAGAHLSCHEPDLAAAVAVAVAACFIRRRCLRSLPGPYFLQYRRRLSSNGLVARVELGKKVVHEVLVVVVVVVVVGGGVVVDRIGIGVGCWWGCRRKDLSDFVLLGTHAVGVCICGQVWGCGVKMTSSAHTSGPVDMTDVCSNTNSSSPPSAISSSPAAATTAVPDAPRSTRASRGSAHLAT
jgi:hypothetical protein